MSDSARRIISRKAIDQWFLGASAAPLDHDSPVRVFGRCSRRLGSVIQAAPDSPASRPIYAVLWETSVWERLKITYAQMFAPLVKDVLELDPVPYGAALLMLGLHIAMGGRWRIDTNWLPLLGVNYM